MAQNKGTTEVDKKHKDQDEKNEEGMKHALANSRVKPGGRVPMWGGMKMAAGNRRVPTKKP